MANGEITKLTILIAQLYSQIFEFKSKLGEDNLRVCSGEIEKFKSSLDTLTANLNTLSMKYDECDDTLS